MIKTEQMDHFNCLIQIKKNTYIEDGVKKLVCVSTEAVERSVTDFRNIFASNS